MNKLIQYRGTVYRLAEPLYDEGFVGQRWGSQGAGLLLTTGEKVLLLLRSGEVEEPGTWGISGGAVRRDSDTGQHQDVKSAALQEAREEMGSLPPYRITGSWIYQEGSFRYTTFVGTVDPEVIDTWSPTLNWENDDYGWFSHEELADLALHFGVEALLTAKQELVFKYENQLLKYKNALYREASRVLEKYRSHNFSNTYYIPDSIRNDTQYRWTIDERNFLNSVVGALGAGPLSFAWHPMSGEMLFGPTGMMHTTLIHRYGAFPFDEYVRGVVSSPMRKEVEIYGWEPQYDLNRTDMHNLSFDGQFALNALLKKIAPDWKVSASSF